MMKMMNLNRDAYYLVDVSYTKGTVTEGDRQGKKYTAERSFYNMIENDFRTKAEAKKYMELHGLQPLKERKLEKYSVTTTGKMMIEDRKRFGIKLNEEYKMEVDSEKIGWTVLNGFDLNLYFGHLFN